MKQKFTVGQQPCDNYMPKIDGNEYAMWDNEHECYKCDGTVSFCENCFWDHHANGYETCKEG